MPILSHLSLCVWWFCSDLLPILSQVVCFPFWVLRVLILVNVFQVCYLDNCFLFHSGFSSHPLDSVPFTKVFNFNEVKSQYFLHGLCLCYYIQKISNPKSSTFLLFSSTSCLYNLCLIFRLRSTLSFLKIVKSVYIFVCMYISSCSTICWEDCLFITFLLPLIWSVD